MIIPKPIHTNLTMVSDDEVMDMFSHPHTKEGWMWNGVMWRGVDISDRVMKDEELIDRNIYMVLKRLETPK